MSQEQENAVQDIILERVRQDRRWGPQRQHSPEHWLAILGEEYGEACEAALEGDLAALRKELIQVAAVAVAASENLEREGEKIRERRSRRNRHR